MRPHFLVTAKAMGIKQDWRSLISMQLLLNIVALDYVHVGEAFAFS
jgi:hypothetical protein